MGLLEQGGPFTGYVLHKEGALLLVFLRVGRDEPPCVPGEEGRREKSCGGPQGVAEVVKGVLGEDQPPCEGAGEIAVEQTGKGERTPRGGETQFLAGAA